MKTYTGTKTLSARPMDRGTYCVYRGWALPDAENGDDEGYLVEYHDGGSANDSRHAGYISWSPKDVFERTYKEVEPPPASLHAYLPHEQRVVVEKTELDGNIFRLLAFIEGHVFQSLPLQDQSNLKIQASIMFAYSAILEQRIANFATTV